MTRVRAAVFGSVGLAKASIIQSLVLNNIMIDPQKKQRLFYNRAHHQIKQIEFSCREVIALSQQITLLAHDITQSELNTRKIEFLKIEIKDKLKEFASNIDEIYKILDRKLVILTREVSRELKNKTNASTSNSYQTNNSLNRSYAIQKDTQKSAEKTQTQQSYDQDRIFSDTLNPRITQLEAKIAQYEQRESLLQSKVSELKNKNQKLLQEFNRLSSASNKKINQLSFQLSNRLEKDRDSFSSVDSKQPFKNSQDKVIRPVLALHSALQLSNSVSENNRYSQQEPLFDFPLQEKSIKKEEKLKSLAFGCMPTKTKIESSEEFTPSKLPGKVEILDKHDKNRRFDLLLNRLRDSQAEKKCAESPPQQLQSVFSQNIVKRYQI